MRLVCDNGCHEVVPARWHCKGRAADFLPALPWQHGLFLGQLLADMIPASTAVLCNGAYTDTLGPRQHAGAACTSEQLLLCLSGFLTAWILQDEGCSPCDINGCICLNSASLDLQMSSYEWAEHMHTASHWSSEALLCIQTSA